MTQTFLLLLGLVTVSIMAIAFYWNNWITKFVVLTFCVVLANSMYFALDGVKGWPAEEPTEVKGTVASVVILNPSSKTQGAIYIGVYLEMPIKWYQYEYPRLAPKTFFVEYSNYRAAEFEKAKKAIQDGKKVEINGIPPKNPNNNDANGDPTDGEDSIIKSITKAMTDLINPKQKDTYKPNESTLKITDLGIPPEKGKE